MNARYARCALCFAIVSATAAQAQPPQPDRQVEEVVVTSSRVPMPLRQIGTSVSVITTEDIEMHGNLSVVDVLRQMPAIATSNSGGAGKATALRIRGEEGFRTLVIFDGLRLSDPSSTQVGSPMEHLLSSGIGRVEVLRGPQGLSYGADAGGIINIDSRQADDGEGLQLNLDAQAGEYGTKQLAINTGGGNETADFFVSLSGFETDGFNTRTTDTVLRDDDGYDNTTVHMRGGYNLTDTLRLELVHRDVDGEAEFDACFNSVTFATSHDCIATSDQTASRAGLSYDGEDFTHALSYATSETVRDNLADGISSFGALGELNRWEYVGTATNLPGFDFVWGADLEEALNNGKGRDNTGIYAEYISDFSDNLHLTAGARHDDNDDFGTNTSYRLSGAYLVDLASGDTLKLKSAYGTGFRAPSPYEIFYNASPDSYPPASLVTLTQETSKGHEFGVELLGDTLRLEAVYFDQDVEDAIEFDLATFSGYLQSIGTSNSMGVELSAEWTVNANWQLSGNYTHNETEQPNGMQRRRRPEELANLGVSYFGMDDRLNVNAYYRVSKDATDGATVLSDFEVLDLSASFQLTELIQLYGRVENAFDEDYEEIASYRTPERAAYVGFRLNFAGL